MSLELKLKRAIELKDITYIHQIFEEIYNTYGKLVYFTIMKYVKNSMDVEDLTQDVFISFYNNISKNDIKNIKYYLVVSAKNKALNFLKQQQKNLILDETVIQSLEDTTNMNTDYFKLLSKMKKYLNDYEIDIIIKHVIYDYTFKDLSKLYNKSINTIISNYHRAVKKYKKGVKEDE